MPYDPGNIFVPNSVSSERYHCLGRQICFNSSVKALQVLSSRITPVVARSIIFRSLPHSPCTSQTSFVPYSVTAWVLLRWEYA